MRCDHCQYWFKVTKYVYDDGSQFVVGNVNYEGRANAHCSVLCTETKPDFFCASFLACANSWDHIQLLRHAGEPWQHFEMKACPDCNGRGCGESGGACGRCMGTGKVRFYADGYIGEEKTRRHPKEPEQKSTVDPGTILAPIEKPSLIQE